MPRLLLVQENNAPGGITRVTQQLTQDLIEIGWTVTSIQIKDGPILGRLINALVLAAKHDVLLATHNFFPAYITWILHLLTRKPWVMWVHGPILEVLELANTSVIKRRFLKWFYARVPNVVSCSYAVRTAYQQYTKQSQLYQLHHVVPNTTSKKFKPMATVHQSSQDTDKTKITHIGFVGRLSPQKRPLDLIELLAHLPANYQLHVVGDGPLMNDLQEQGAQLIHQNRLHIHGQQTVVASTFHQWAATVLCSAYEGYPMTALESLACGVPCVSTPIAPMQELLDQHAPYMLASNHSPQALAHAVIDTLATSPVKRQHDMNAIIQAHTPEQFAQSWSNLLHATIKS
jgi:glycosyltransferase involved in cell wall biosynthesis